MIRVDLNRIVKDKNEKMHRCYIEQTALNRLEERIERQITEYKFLIKLFGDTKEKRRSCIVKFCILDDLEELIEIFEKFFLSVYKFSYKEPGNKKEKDIVKRVRNLLDDILNYRGFNVGENIIDEQGEECEWNRHLFVANIGIKVCPYCNRQYITSYTAKDESDKTTADIDHYYPKSLYPYLQMNIYNMIPSCSVCNSKMKGKSDERHLNPYKDSTESLKFEISLNDFEGLYASEVKEIIINKQGNPRAMASNVVFKLDKVYQVHTKEISKLIFNIKQYEAFKESYYKNTMGIDIGNIFSIWFDFLGEDPLDEPLVKLKKDIYEQLLTAIEKL